MTDLSDLVLPAAVVTRLAAKSRKQAVQALSECVARAGGLDPARIVRQVLARERLAGTGVGEGVALPHAVVDGLARPVGGFARLDPPINFAALDGRAADLVFLLLAPKGQHLKALARISRFFRRADAREKLRAARTREEMCAVFATALAIDAA